MARADRAQDLANDLSPEEEAARYQEFQQFYADQAAQNQAKNQAKADADAAKAAGRDPGIASLLKQLGADNEATRAISGALYDKYGLTSLADLGRGKARKVDPVYTQTSFGDSGDAGYWSEPSEVQDWINKKTGEVIGKDGYLDLGYLDKDKVGTTYFNLDPTGQMGTRFNARAKGKLWESGLMEMANMVPGLNAYTIPLTMAHNASKGDWGKVAGALAGQFLPGALDYAVGNTDLLSSFAGPDFNPVSTTPSGMLLEAATGIQGNLADILGAGGLGAATSALRGGDVGMGALMGALNPAIKSGMAKASDAIDASGKQDFLNRYESDLAGDDINGNFAINNTATPGYNDIDQQGLILKGNDIDQLGMTDISPEQRIEMEDIANRLAIDTQLGDLTGGADEDAKLERETDADNRNVKTIEDAQKGIEPSVEQVEAPEEDAEIKKVLADEAEQKDKLAAEDDAKNVEEIESARDLEDVLGAEEKKRLEEVEKADEENVKTIEKAQEPVVDTKKQEVKTTTPKPPDYSKIISGLLKGYLTKQAINPAKKPGTSPGAAPVTAPVGIATDPTKETKEGTTEPGLPSVPQTFNWGYQAKEAPKAGVTYGHQYFSPTWGQPEPEKPIFAFDQGGSVNFQSVPDPGITFSELTMPSDNPTVMPSSYNEPTFAQGGAAKMGGEQFLKAAHEAGLRPDKGTLNQIVDLVNHGIPLHTAAKMVAEQSNKGIASLGGFSDGGRMLKGPGDGMSDDIPATIAGKQPARLANEEFVIPADVVSHLGNGSSEAGSRVLYDMMAKVRKARTGNPEQGKKINPHKFMPR
jgi:hypothetical protein